MAAGGRRSLSLTGRGRVLLALGLVSQLIGWAAGDAHVQLAAAILCAPVLVDLLAKPRALARVRVAMRANRAIATVPFRDQWLLTLPGRGRLRELDVGPPPLRSRGAFVDLLDARTPVQLAVTCVSRERGCRAVRDYELATGWPFGLLRLRWHAQSPAELVTEPARVPVDSRLLAEALAPGATAEASRGHHGDEFHSLREHRPDEDARRVHAQRSAALGQLVHTERRSAAPRHVAVVIDLRRPAEGAARTLVRRFERSLGVAATVLDRLAEGGVIAHVTFAGETWATAQLDAPQRYQDALRRLAEVEPCAHRPLDAAWLAALRNLSPCYWIAADRAAVQRELGDALRRVHVLGGDG